MLVSYSKEMEQQYRQGGGRYHPWTAAEYNLEAKYYDLKKQPELIETALEDFVPYAAWPAVQTFYKLLRWMNGPESYLESNDCTFTGPRENLIDKQFKKALRCYGRLMVLNRVLQYNTFTAFSDWLARCYEFHLRRVDPTFDCGAVALSKVSAGFVELPGGAEKNRGKQLVLNFWAYGDDEAETMKNLDRLFTNLFEASRKVSIEIEEGIRGDRQRAEQKQPLDAPPDAA